MRQSFVVWVLPWVLFLSACGADVGRGPAMTGDGQPPVGPEVDGGEPGIGSDHCTPGEVRACYDGPAGTEGMGSCRRGVTECRAVDDASDPAWGTCVDTVRPQIDWCGNGMDEDCNGIADDGEGCIPCPPAPWTTVIVDTGGVGEYSSLVLDPEGGVHVAYYDSTNRDLKHGYKAPGGAWDLEVVDSVGDVGAHSSLAIDAQRGLHVAYYDLGARDLKYASRPYGGAWATRTLADPDDDVGQFAKIAVGPTWVHLTYYCYGCGHVKYAHMAMGGGDFTPRSIAFSSFSDVAVSDEDDEGQVHMLHAFPGSPLWYVQAADAWTTEVAASFTGGYPSLAVGASGDLHATWYGDRTLAYGFKPVGGAWTTVVVDEGAAAPGVGGYNSPALDSNGGIHVSYHDFYDLDLKYAFKPAGGDWTTTRVDCLGDVGLFTSLAVDESRGVHISYHGLGGILKYAYSPPP